MVERRAGPARTVAEIGVGLAAMAALLFGVSRMGGPVVPVPELDVAKALVGDEAPVGAAPVVAAAPVGGAPVAAAPVDEAPVAAVVPVDEAPVVAAAPVGEAPAAAAPAGEAPVAAAVRVDEAPVVEDAAPVVAAPVVAVARIAADGAAVVAGQAEPGARVSIYADARRIAVAEADSDGNFVAIFKAEPSVDPKALTFGSATEGAEEAVSDEVVVLLPKEEGFAAAAVLSPKGADVTPLAAPTDKVSLASISYAAEGQVTLAGFGMPGSAVRAYVNDVFAEDGKVTADGRWSLALRDVAGGVNRLRIDQLAGDGRVASRVETPFQRDFPVPDRPGTVVVQPGGTLWAMARVHYGSGARYTQIFKANSDLIADPDLIYPGQIFRLPE